MAAPDQISDQERSGLIDRWPARLVALLVVISCIASLVWIHRNDLFPGQDAVAQSGDPAAECIAARHGEVDRMRADGVIDDGQAVLFKSRGEAFCRAQAGQRGAPPLSQ